MANLFLKAGRPKTPKEQAIEAVQDVSDEMPPAVETEPDPEPAAKPKMQRFNVDLPEDLHRRMKARAATEGVKMNALTAKIFEEYLSKHSNE